MNVCLSHLEEDPQVPEISLSVFRDLAAICSYNSQITTVLKTYSVPKSFQFSPALISHPPVRAHYSHYGGERRLVERRLIIFWPWSPRACYWSVEGFPVFLWESKNEKKKKILSARRLSRNPCTLMQNTFKDLVGARNPKVFPHTTWIWILVFKVPSTQDQENEPKWA